jgi:hypothetical protein
MATAFSDPALFSEIEFVEGNGNYLGTELKLADDKR